MPPAHHGRPLVSSEATTRGRWGSSGVARPQGRAQQPVNSASRFPPPHLSARWAAGGSEFSQSLSKQFSFIRNAAHIYSFFSQDKSGQLQGNLHSPSYLHKMETGRTRGRKHPKRPARACSTPPSISNLHHRKSGGSIHPCIHPCMHPSLAPSHSHASRGYLPWAARPVNDFTAAPNCPLSSNHLRKSKRKRQTDH